VEGVLCWTGSCFLREAIKYLLRLDVLNLRSPTPESLQAIVSSPLIGFAGADHPLRSLGHPLNLWHLNLWQLRSDRANCPSRLMTVD
jgi:hypothetical protein